jgi:LysR family transcriptional regulator, transcriptional activator of the cysJI operon
MEDSRLKAFCLIVEMKSFSKAAEAAFVTQSAMSHLIKNLEDELGGKLLNRSGKTITPTSAGKILYDHAKKILEGYKSLENDIYNVVKKIKGPLYLGASTTVAKYLLPQVLYDFSRNYPEAQLNLSVSGSEKVISELHQGKIDIGIVEGNIGDKRIIFREIARDEIVLIASDGNPLTRRKIVTPQYLMDQSFILPEAGSGTREIIDEFLSIMKIEPQDINVIMTLSDPELLVQMVQSGLGIAFVSKWSIFKTIKEGTIKILRMPGKRLYRKFYLIVPDKEPSTMVSRTFLEFVKGYSFFMPF